MRKGRGNKLGCIIALALISFLSIYYAYFPIVVTAPLTNALVLASLVTIILIIVSMAFRARSYIDAIFVLIPASLLAFLARSIISLRSSYPNLHDPYYHLVSTQNIIDHGTLTSQISDWYELADFQLHWPDMHLLTVYLNQVAGIDIGVLFRYQEPLLGVAFLLGVYLITKALFKRQDVALTAALLAGFSDIIIFYQSEYHPQGFAFVLFVFLIYAFIKSREANIAYSIVLIIFLIALVLSHHFSSLLVALVAFGAIALGWYIQAFRRFAYDRSTFVRDSNTWLLIGIAAFSYHIFAYSAPLKVFISMLEIGLAESTLSVEGVDTLVPTLMYAAPLLKWTILLLALLSLFVILHQRERRPNIDRLFMLSSIFLLLGVAGMLVESAPLDRLIAFTMPLLAPFAAMLLVWVRENWWRRFRTEMDAMVLVVIIASAPMVAGILNAPTAPAYTFQGTAFDTQYWNSNYIPDMDQYSQAGSWMGARVASNASVGTEFDTNIVPFYFAGLPFNRTIFEPQNYNLSYILVNPDVPYDYAGIKKERLALDLNVVYANRELSLYKP